MHRQLDETIGRRIRQRRRLLCMTQVELGERCGVRFQQVQKYESAVNRISAVMLWKIARALDVEIDFFFRGLEDRRPLATPAAFDQPGEPGRAVR